MLGPYNFISYCKEDRNNDHNQFFNIGGLNDDFAISYEDVVQGFADHVYPWLNVQDQEAPVPAYNKMSSACSHLLNTIAVEGVATKAIVSVTEISRTR